MSYDLFCVGVVFYYPTREQVDKIQEYLKLVNKVYIYDNSEDNKENFVNKVHDIKEFDYTFHNRNDGISKALNSLCTKARADGYDYILILDQDSIFDLNNISILFDAVSKNTGKNIGVFSPKSKPIKSIEETKKESVYIAGSHNISEISWTITSGSVIDLNVFIDVGGFDENLFIDKVDYDYCMTLKKQGYKTVVIQDAFLFQFLGEPSGGIFNFFQHNYIRHYYLFRNRFYIVDKYKESYQGYKKTLFLFSSIIRHILIILLFETDKYKKLAAINLAFKDYKNNKMGRCSHF